jgi:hypothetical protein
MAAYARWSWGTDRCEGAAGTPGSCACTWGRIPRPAASDGSRRRSTAAPRYARGQLAELAGERGRARLRAGTLSDLLERWFEVTSPGWAASTASHTRTVIECYLRPHLGHLPVNKITTEDIDDFYAYPIRSGGERDQPLAPGSVARVHGVLHRAFAQAVRWDWVLVNPASAATPPRVPPPISARPARLRWRCFWSGRDCTSRRCSATSGSPSQRAPGVVSFWRSGGAMSTRRPAPSHSLVASSVELGNPQRADPLAAQIAECVLEHVDHGRGVRGVAAPLVRGSHRTRPAPALSANDHVVELVR